MAIRNIFLVASIRLLCVCILLVAGISAPSFAGTQIAGSRQHVCNVIIEYPSRMEFGLENATCDQNGNLVGQHSISITVDLAIRNGVRFTFDSNFLNGRLNGLTSIQTDAGFSFDGEIFPGGRTVGRTISFDGSVVEGETRGGVANLTGTVTRRNGQVIYYINGRESEASAFADNQSPNPTSSNVSLARATPSPLIISEMTTVDLGQSQFCLADLPAAQYEISGVFSGRCKDRYYTGKAKLTLTPKQGSGVLPMIATLKYQSGQIIGPVEISYIGSEAKYKGTLQNWTPLAGSLSEPIGNDEYRVVDIAEGLSVAERTEHREPSFGKQLLQRVAKVALVNLQDCLSGGCEQERLAEQARRDRKAQERQTAIYEQQQAQIREQQRQNDVARQAENDRYVTEQANIRSQQLAAIEDARIKQLAGLDRDGYPIVQPVAPVVIARNDPPPVFVVDTRPPAPTVTTNPQVDPPAITTPPPELALPTAGNNAPPPLPSGQPLPEQSPSPLAPPVQLGGGGDTLETGQPVPSYPVPQSEPVVGPATPSQPASNASTQNYGSTPTAYAQQLSGSDLALNNRLSPSNPQRIENQMSAGQLGQIIRSGQIVDWRAETQAAINRQNGTQTAGNAAGSGGSQTADIPQALVLGAPRPLAPTNPGELNPTVPLQWLGVTGATYYQLAVRDLTTNDLVVNLSVNGTSHTASPYTVGRTFRWNVAACNAAGCSPNRSESWTFRTGGSPSASVTSDSQCGQITRYQQAIIDGYYGLEQQQGATKPNQAVLCRWQQLGTLDANLTDFQRSITAAANSGPNLPSAERRRIAREAVRNSPLVQKAVSDLYYKIGEDYATKGLRSQLPSEANFLVSAIRFVDGGFDQIEQNRSESYIIRNVSNINYMASYMVNQISGYYTKRLGIDIPASKLINLSGTAIGVYADAYVSGQ